MNRPRDGAPSATQAVDPILSRYEPVIGLEVHCQLKTDSKLFCGCSTTFGASPNFNTCPVCLGHPGVLPVLNRKSVDYAVKMALAVGATVHETSVFARKQYFYPDLPKGYQITQYDLPYCTEGLITLAGGQTIRIARIHIEEDAGKNVHSGNSSFVDLNRAGIPLLEIVSHPDLHTPEDAADYLRRLRSIVRFLDISDGNMEEGSFRCDANVSIRPRGSQTLGTRAEIKNLNSFKNVERAISYEIYRQADIIDSGEKVAQETLLFDATTGKTSPMRSKEESHDYRYFPDPDLKPLRITAERIEAIRKTLPELPLAMARRFQDQFELTEYDASLLTSEKEIARYFEDVVKLTRDAVAPKIVANWISSELLREVRQRDWNLAEPFIKPEQMAELLRLIGDETISGKIAKKVFEEMAETGDSAKTIVAKRGLVQVTDTSEIASMVDSILDENPEQVAQYLSGKDKVFGFFVGQAMRRSAGKFNPALLNQILRERLDAKKS